MSDAGAFHDDGTGGDALIADPVTVYVVYTDGSCKPNPGVGGWAYVLTHDDEMREGSGEEGIAQDTVSPRMEVLAVVRALEATPPGSVVVVRTDSAYVHDSITRHIKGCATRKFLCAARQPTSIATVRAMGTLLWRTPHQDVAGQRLEAKWRSQARQAPGSLADALGAYAGARRRVELATRPHSDRPGRRFAQLIASTHCPTPPWSVLARHGEPTPK
jgi:ribonuclease HI